MKLERPRNQIIRQANYNYLSETKSDKQNVFIIETPPGIGTIYSLGIIHGSLGSITLSIDQESDLEYNNSTHCETVIADINKNLELKDGVIINKLKVSGFSKIIIVKTILESV